MAGEQLLGHPKGLFVCFLTEMWERFAFYGMKALLLLYLTKHRLFADADGYLLLGTYAGLAYALPLLGGILADRWIGMRKAVIYGGILLVLGQLGMAWTGHAATGVQGAAQQDATAIQVMYFSLALIGVGVGFLKPNISTIVGRLYPDNDPRRDSGRRGDQPGLARGGRPRPRRLRRRHRHPFLGPLRRGAAVVGGR